MMSSEQLLESAARDGFIDVEEWPRVLDCLLQRLHDIVHTGFPLPPVPLPAPAPLSSTANDADVVASTPPLLSASDPAVDESEELPDADADADAGVDNELVPSSSQSSTKENDVPADMAVRRPAVPGFSVNRAYTHPSAQPSDGVDMLSDTLPPDLRSSYVSSTRTLERDFPRTPPHTIQRLAELVMHPRKHYRFLPAYLRALDRVVSVTSSVSEFPLPMMHTPSDGGFLTNGDGGMLNGVSEREGLGSDESLGGALLTPIPWLNNNGSNNINLATAAAARHSDAELRSESTLTIEGPYGAGSVETVTVTVNGVPSAMSAASHSSPARPSSPTLSDQSDASSSSSSGTMEAQLREQGAVTQGELLRQEQEAGVVPLSQAPPRRPLFSPGGGPAAVTVGRGPRPRHTVDVGPSTDDDDVLMADDAPADDLPHARGPEEIGMEDMGPQDHPVGPDGGAALDIDAAVGRRSKSPQPPPSASAADISSPEPLSADGAGVRREADARDGGNERESEADGTIS